jgi:type III restriction enzyme
VSFRGTEGDEKSAFSLGFCEKQIPHFVRNDSQRHFFNKLLKALRDRSHPYRQALDSAFGGQVEVMSLAEALYVTRGTLDGATAIIVSTLAAMRVEETEGRKICETNGVLQPISQGLQKRNLLGSKKQTALSPTALQTC